MCAMARSIGSKRGMRRICEFLCGRVFSTAKKEMGEVLIRWGLQ